MPRSKPPYPPEFRARIVELARSGRQLRGLSKEFGVTDTTIRSWRRQADLDEGRRSDGLTSDEKKELAQLRKENARLREGHPLKSGRVVRAGGHLTTEEGFRFVRANHATHSASVMCRCLGVSESGYHAWRK